MWNCALKFSKQRGECSKTISQILVYYIINCFTLVFNGFELLNHVKAMSLETK